MNNIKKEYVLALYDFASKQEFIYRTSKIKEISGASELLAGMYNELIATVNEFGIDGRKILYLKNEEENELEPFCMDEFSKRIDILGQVLYDGGGNLMVMYKSKGDFIAANKIMSRYLIQNGTGLSMICSSTEIIFDDNEKENFSKTVEELYRRNKIRKNTSPVANMWEVTPMTQTDPQTFLPVTFKGEDHGKEVSMSADRYVKKSRYNKIHKKDLTPEDFSGLTAVVYIDGNSLGKRVKECTNVHSFDEGVYNLRTLSKEIGKHFINDPEEELRTFLDSSDEKPSFRKILGAGDEITFICDAEVALKLVLKYFDVLEKSNAGRKEDTKNYSCAGIAVAHSKTPFNMVYEIAEAACESAKALSRSKNGNYIDFYYCHMGVTNDFEAFRKREQYMTGKPYSINDLSAVINNIVPKLLAAGRANVKSLGEAAQKSKTKYLLEVQRINAYIVDKCNAFVKNPYNDEEKQLFKLAGFNFTSSDLEDPQKAEETAMELAKMLCFASEDKPGFYEEMQNVYDLSEFFDLWFSTAEKFADLTGVTK